MKKLALCFLIRGYRPAPQAAGEPSALRLTSSVLLRSPSSSGEAVHQVNLLANRLLPALLPFRHLIHNQYFAFFQMEVRKSYDWFRCRFFISNRGKKVAFTTCHQPHEAEETNRQQEARLKANDNDFLFQNKVKWTPSLFTKAMGYVICFLRLFFKKPALNGCQMLPFTLLENDAAPQ
ncbi:hypothetical protein ACD591_10945 [Rufibacter glacialis]|uniref:Uncharacterized protein n=1 Tax=Rufibacter glacialis TaxID=1259555 RepID=A0A5M8Q751_9BACT|nr:hypothetical protein [Rufibacter glacialis]KAA6431729.1 hypothetical protein FOE74_16550 [Rufibacter glacialis]